MQKWKKIIILCLAAAVCLAVSGCGDKQESGNGGIDFSQPQKVLVTMENGKTFTIETAPQYAPETAENFLNLVQSGFYNGLTFHRIIDGFMAQGGDPNGNGTGGSEKTIKGEFAANGYSKNTLSHTRGVVSMARQPNDMDSASSQFFICYDTAPHLDGEYAAFGRVTEGMETVDEFLKTPRDNADKPITPIVIKSMEIISQ
ncbi:peptidylprolyl isomerase [Ructibacterium gallinarum]|uniref:Peptidyl-prolyl cis-trans isomerase n=1 Tax=Ructibacterium gallinarum TaxID=2779355 RepID=A0A9D5M2N1_9FIRM|nr:peptidylprolyl isomerase [Ructibacterium gallinarum]MBE5039554.1 peptidylprolyl isomerase [Ructibacterium gallinarum]